MAVFEPIYDTIEPIGGCDEPSSVHCIDLLLDDDAVYEGVLPFGSAGGPHFFEMTKDELSSSSDEERDLTIAPSVGSSELSEEGTLEDMLSRKRGCVSPYGTSEPFRIDSQPTPSADTECASLARRPGFVGAYSPEERRDRIARFHEKRARRVWKKRVRLLTMLRRATARRVSLPIIVAR